MLKKKLRFGLIMMVAFAFWILPNVAKADSINYQALKYGTNEESMASNYYVKPATVVANGDQYLVTMTIHTSNDLGKWPVTVLSINGTGPANVSKTQGNGGYNYSYAFQTDNLKKTISSSISINVPDVYVAKHDISFKFDTDNLPTLASTSGSKSSESVKSSSSKTSKSEASSSQKQSEAESSKVSAATKKQAAQIKALNQKNKETQTAIIIGGSAAVIILGVAAYFFIRRK